MQAAREAGLSPGMPAAVADALRRGALVITPNRRVSRALGRVFDAGQRQSQLSCWDSARILPLPTWLHGLWQELVLDGVEARVVLNGAQQHALWREIVLADADLPRVRPVDALAEGASRAWHLLHLYRGSLEDPEFRASPDPRAFARWAKQFARLCSQGRFLTPSELPSALERALSQGRLTRPCPALLLVDFDEHAPAHRFLLDGLRRSGVSIEETETDSAAGGTGTLHAAADPAQEVYAAAEWVRERLEETPAARIAVVVPDLAARRSLLARVFSERLGAGLSPTADPAGAMFEFSLGQPLAETGPGGVALDLLGWSLGPLSLDRIGPLLLSPFLTSLEELDSAARFDAFDLRTAPLLRPELTVEQTLALLSRSAVGSRLGDLEKRLRAFRDKASGATLEQSHAAHAEHFSVLLEAVGWTRAVGSGSSTAQILRRWESALDELATLDFRHADRVQPSSSAALETLTRIARETIFAPQSQDAPVQILGPLELGGVAFDGLWFLSSDDRTWPVRPGAHPLLPPRLQRRLRMPGGHALEDERRARALTQRVARSASEVVFSYARRSEESDRRASPLLRELALGCARVPLPRREGSPEPYLRAAECAELPPLPDAVVRGGERVLKDQAACAFRAFAEHRLWSTELATRDPGLDPRDRGSLVHRILETFWDQVHDRQALSELGETQRHRLLDEAIDLALERPGRQVRSAWDSAYLEVERERLGKLLRPWLRFELDRPDFSVQQQEQRLSDVTLGGLRLALRVDRVDDTAAGPLILDYKTGAASPSDWLTDRPDAPQLPLYAVLNPAESLGGVAFALLRAGKDQGMKVFSDDPRAILRRGPVFRMQLSLADQREEWRRVLTNLASAFASGDTRVEPKSYPGSCQYCSQRVVCRLDPASLPASSTGDGDEEEVSSDG